MLLLLIAVALSGCVSQDPKSRLNEKNSCIINQDWWKCVLPWNSTIPTPTPTLNATVTPTNISTPTPK